MATGITENDVWQAADALLLEGARPTIERVRQKIGRGSPNTVSPYLDSWFGGLGARISDRAAFSAPAVPDPVAQAAAQLWEAALGSAQAQLAQAAANQKAETQAIRHGLEKEQAHVQQQAQRLAERERDLQDAVAMLKSQLHAAEARASALDAERQRALGQLAELASQQREASQAQARLAQELRLERAQHADERAAAEERSRAQEKRWLNELDIAREAGKRLSQQHDLAQKAAQSRIAELASQAAEAQAGLQQARDDLARADAQKQVSAKAAEASQMAIDTLQAQVQQAWQVLQQTQAAQSAREGEWQEQSRQLRTQVEQTQAQLAQLLAQAASRQAEIAALRQDAAASAATPVQEKVGGKRRG